MGDRYGDILPHSVQFNEIIDRLFQCMILNGSYLVT